MSADPMNAGPASRVGQGPLAEGQARRYAFLLLLAYLLFYIAPLGLRPLMIPDEIRYGEIPREMIESGDWVAPHLNGLRYFEKPVLGYWVVAVSMRLFGENAFALRLPSALAAGLSALCLFVLLWRARRDARLALSAAVIFLSLFGVYLIGTYNILDSGFSFWLTAAFCSFYLAHASTDTRRRNAALVALGLCTGAAFLSKGFLAFALLGLVVVPFVLWKRRWRELFSLGWLPLLTAVLLILPWALMVHLREPDFWRYFFWEEHVRRFLADDAQHGEPAWFYLAWLPLLAAPWVLQGVSVLKGLGRREAGGGKAAADDLTPYLLLWLALPFLFFSASRGKLPTYILPCLAPLAAIMAIALHRYFAAGGAGRAFRYGAALAAVVCALLAAALFALQQGWFGEPLWQRGESAKWLALLAALLLAAALFLGVMRPAPAMRRVAGFALALMPLLLVLQAALPLRTAFSKMPVDFLRANRDLVTPDTVLLSDDIMIHAVNWVYHRSDVIMTGAGESRHGLSFDDARGRLLQGDALRDFIMANLGRRNMVLIHHADALDKMRAMMPPQAEMRRWGLFVLWYLPAMD